MNHQPIILALMQDGQPRTSHEICDVIYGPQPDGAKWWRVASMRDRMVQAGRLVTCGKVERKTVYQIAPHLTGMV